MKPLIKRKELTSKFKKWPKSVQNRLLNKIDRALTKIEIRELEVEIIRSCDA